MPCEVARMARSKTPSADIVDLFLQPQVPKRTKRTKYQRQVNDPAFDLRCELWASQSWNAANSRSVCL
jgi:hypothetical protein